LGVGHFFERRWVAVEFEMWFRIHQRVTLNVQYRIRTKKIAIGMEINRPIDSQKREPSPSSTDNLANERRSKKPRLEGDVSLSRDLEAKKKPKLSKRARQKLLRFEPGSPDDVLWRDVKAILGNDAVDDAIRREVDFEAPVTFGDEFELEVIELGSNGQSTRSRALSMTEILPPTESR
jgi:hypothetical protein